MEDIAKPGKSDRDLLPPPLKKRKVYRKRPQSEDEEVDSIHIASPPTANALEPAILDKLISQSSRDADAKSYNEQETPLSVTEILRQRKAIQRRKAGIEFRAVDTASRNDSSEAKAKATSSLLDKEDTLDRIITVVDRFAPQTGQVADVDQHMYATPYLALLGPLMHMLTSEGWRI